MEPNLKLAAVDAAAKTADSSKAKDPVCGMTVNKTTAKHTLLHAGTTYYFCCAGCASKFKADPDKYLKQPQGGTAGGLVTLGAPTSKPVMIAAASKPAMAGANSGKVYVCPMCPEVREAKPVPCPSCGMALEPETPQATQRTQYVCPMHAEIVRDQPGHCPICGMALEPKTVAMAEDNPELREMTRRFWVSLALTVPLLAIAMGDMAVGSGLGIRSAGSSGLLPWLELLLATPVVLWGGWPFFQRGWASVVNRSANMFTLIAMGTGVAYSYSLVATVFPQSFRIRSGT